jgi:hypothetical protein
MRARTVDREHVEVQRVHLFEHTDRIVAFYGNERMRSDQISIQGRVKAFRKEVEA